MKDLSTCLKKRKLHMTLPDERYRAVVQTIQFLTDICNTPRIPKTIKERARSLLRHYPTVWDMQRTALQAPDVFQERLEPLYRMVKAYDQEKNNGK
jgi:hypothetical protein